VTPLRRRPNAVLAVLWVLAGCAHGEPLLRRYTQAVGRDHPLVGTVWSRSQKSAVDPDALRAAVRASSTLLLGESHDNRDHHALEAVLLTQFLSAHPSASVGFEMLDADQGARLSAEPAGNAEELAARVGWAESGWPDFAMYRPVFDAAFARHAPVLALHPSPQAVRASMAGVSAAEAEELALDTPLSAEAQAELAHEITESHCGHASPALVEAMSRAQSYKDAFMARQRRLRGGAESAVVAGRGHVRDDRGIPLFLARRGTPGRVLSVGFVEVRAGLDAPADYGAAPFDFVVFTPAASDEDPCQRFREQLQKLRAGAGDGAPRSGAP